LKKRREELNLEKRLKTVVKKKEKMLILERRED
jgi:hypothetical protein